MDVLDSIGRDLRCGLRRWRRERGVAVPAVLTVALTIGLATAVWSVADAILIQPFPYPQPNRLLAAWKATPDVDFFPLPVPELLDVKARARSVEDIGGFTREGFVLLAPSGARWADAFEVTTNLLDVLGVRAIRGRTFRPEDGEPGREKVAVIGEPLWREAFEADPAIVGRFIRLKPEGSKTDRADEYRVVGVVATEVEIYYPNRLRAQMYVPRVLTAEDRSEQARSLPSLITVARLRPGVPVAEGIKDVAAAMTASANEHKAVSFPGAAPRVASLHEELVGRTRPAFMLLAAASTLLLLIGCANVANLLLASGVGRRPEFMARLALGCSRGRLLRQLLTEHVLLAAGGGLLGIVLAAWATPLLRRLVPASLPRAGDIRIDGIGLAVALALSVVVWLLSGLLPAAAATRGGRLAWDNTASRTATGGSSRLRGALVVTQMGLVVALLGAAALLAKGIWRLSSVDLGFHPREVLAAEITLPEAWWWRAGPKTAKIERELIERLSADTRFTGVTVGSELPFTWGVLGGVRKRQSDRPARSLVAAAGDRYFALLGIEVRQGRPFDWRDDGNTHVVVINEKLNRQLFEGSGLGQRVLIEGEWRDVVGIVGDVTEVGELRAGLIRRAGFDRLTLPAAYVPIGAAACTSHFLLCRTRLEAAAATAAIRTHLRAIEPEAAVRRSGWLEERVEAAGADARFCALVVGVFAFAALALAAIGVYGMLANAVRERIVEIGIRSALGASPSRLRWTMTRALLASVGAGGALGVAALLLGGRALRSFLFEVPPRDPSTLAATLLFLLAVAGMSAYFPARAITRLDAARALRAE